MNIYTITRAGALGMIIAGAALGYSYVPHPHHMTPESIASTFWVVIHSLFALSLVLGLLGTLTLYAPTAERAGRWGLAGFLSLFVGMILIFGLDYYEVLIAPYFAANYPQVIIDHGAGDAMGPVAVFFPLAGALTVVGYAMLAYGWMKGVLPKAVALAMIVSALAFGFGLSPLGGLMAARVTAAAFGAALIAIGISAWLSASSAGQRARAVYRATGPAGAARNHPKGRDTVLRRMILSTALFCRPFDPDQRRRPFRGRRRRKSSRGPNTPFSLPCDG